MAVFCSTMFQNPGGSPECDTEEEGGASRTVSSLSNIVYMACTIQES